MYKLTLNTVFHTYYAADPTRVGTSDHIGVNIVYHTYYAADPTRWECLIVQYRCE